MLISNIVTIIYQYCDRPSDPKILIKYPDANGAVNLYRTMLPTPISNSGKLLEGSAHGDIHNSSRSLSFRSPKEILDRPAQVAWANWPTFGQLNLEQFEWKTRFQAKSTHRRFSIRQVLFERAKEIKIEWDRFLDAYFSCVNIIEPSYFISKKNEIKKIERTRDTIWSYQSCPSEPSFTSRDQGKLHSRNILSVSLFMFMEPASPWYKKESLVKTSGMAP